MGNGLEGIVKSLCSVLGDGSDFFGGGRRSGQRCAGQKDAIFLLSQDWSQRIVLTERSFPFFIREH